MNDIIKKETPLKSTNKSKGIDKGKTVQMRLLNKTLERIDNIKRITDVNNRTQIVSIAIQLAEIYFQNVDKGNKIQIAKENGEIETIYFGV